MILPFRNNTPVIHPSCFIAPSADVIGDVVIGKNASIWFGAVIRGDMHTIRIGAETNIQDGATVHVTTNEASVTVGTGVTIGHNAVIHGCTIENDCLIGMGATVMDNAIVGEGSIIGAGALVPPGMRIPPRTLCVGLPAKPIRGVSSEEFNEIRESAAHYIEFAGEYLSQSIPG